MNTHVVDKPLPMGGETLKPGTEVDASNWRNARLLVEQRYLSPIQTTQPDERKAARGKEGRKDGTNTGD